MQGAARGRLRAAPGGRTQDDTGPASGPPMRPPGRRRQAFSRGCCTGWIFVPSPICSRNSAKTGGRCFWTAQQAAFDNVRFAHVELSRGGLERAIRRGGSHLPRGTPISRVQAVQTAARQGLDELAPLSEEYLDTLTAVRRKTLSLETAPALFELSGGAETEMEAPAVALTRLEEMNDEELFGRLQEEEPFRAAVLDIAGRACEADAVTGARGGCGAVGRIVARLKPLGPRSEPGELRGSPIEWLRRLDDLSSPRVFGGDTAEKTVSASRRLAQPAGIDPCTLPEIPDAEHWTPGPTTVGGYYVILRDLSSRTDGAVSVADGIRGHEPARTIRLKLDLRDRSGGRRNLSRRHAHHPVGKGWGILERARTRSRLLIDQLLLESGRFRRNVARRLRRGRPHDRGGAAGRHDSRCQTPREPVRSGGRRRSSTFTSHGSGSKTARRCSRAPPSSTCGLRA